MLDLAELQESRTKKGNNVNISGPGTLFTKTIIKVRLSAFINKRHVSLFIDQGMGCPAMSIPALCVLLIGVITCGFSRSFSSRLRLFMIDIALSLGVCGGESSCPAFR
jgi:hypothetical protein